MAYRPRTNAEDGVWDLMARHVRHVHGIRSFDWCVDTTGGHCRLCWRRLPPGGVLHHWTLYHGYAGWTKHSDYHDPTGGAFTPSADLVPAEEVSARMLASR